MLPSRILPGHTRATSTTHVGSPSPCRQQGRPPLHCPPLRVADAGVRASATVESQPTRSPAAPPAEPRHVQVPQQHHQHHQHQQQSLQHQQQQHQQKQPQQRLQQQDQQRQQHAASASPSSAEADAQLLFDFDPSHIPAWTPLLALYFPFGVIIAVLRMSLWVGGALWDASWFRNPAVVQTYLSLLGFKAVWRNTHLLPAGRHIMVSNHVTPGDLMVLFQGLPQRYTHLITTAMPPHVVATKNLPCTLRFATPEVLEQLASTSGRAAGGKQQQQQKQQQPGMSSAEQQQPVHLFPEGGVTHGRWGMMQFTRGFTRLLGEGDWVVPVALKARTPWGIRTHTLLSSFPANLFWMSFCPWLEMEATILDPMQLQPGEAKGAFAKRVQAAIAAHLGQAVSECNITVKKRVMQQQAKLRKGA